MKIQKILYTIRLTRRGVLLVIASLIVFLLLSIYFAIDIGKTEDLWDTWEIWDKVKLVGNYSDSDPLFSDSTGVKATLIKDAYSWLQNTLQGYGFLDKLTLSLVTTSVSYDLEPQYYIDEILPVKIKAIRHKDTGNKQSLTSMSIDDFMKVSITKGALPEVYAYDRNQIWFNSYPSSDTVTYIWAYRIANTDSVCVWGRYPPLMPSLRHILIIKIVALNKERENNIVAFRNISGIAKAMLGDVVQRFRMDEATKDVRVLPKVFNE